ncbi:MAG: isocitrate lyase/PEP mutase family protein [Chloroflexota bacterium]
MADPKQQAETLFDLHHGSQPLLLPNVWDVASAQAVAGEGFPVIATSSRAIAASLGFPDADVMPADTAFDAVRRIAGDVDLPVTADLEAGYQLPAADFVERLLQAGAVGCNLEDTDHHGSSMLAPIERQSDRLRAIRRATNDAGVRIVINARIDIFLHGSGDPQSHLAEAIERGKAYLSSGADCLYPIGLEDTSVIAEFVREVDAPVNIWLRPNGPSLEALAKLGVARVSLASGLFHVAMKEVQRQLRKLRAEARDLPA